MSTELIDRLARFDGYIEELKAHDWSSSDNPEQRHKWSANQAAHKKLQETMKAEDHHFKQAYFIFTNWHYSHHDDELRDHDLKHVRKALAIEATTALINPSPEPT